MRFRHRDGTTVHLAYGTNVHPAEDVDGLIAQLHRYGEPVRAALGVDRMGLGLWLPAPAAARLVAEPGQLTRLRDALDRAGLEVVTLNAFPYAHFHAPVVKHAVYRPDWTERSRLDYTLDCAQVLAALLPDDASRGSISTLPLGWRSPWSPADQAGALAQLDQLAEGLAAVAARTGRTVRVGIEPEPGCVVETTADAVAHLGTIDTEYIGMCLDTCHLSTAFEDPVASVAALEVAGLPVVKAQLAAALHVDRPADSRARAALAGFAEDRFLHQVRELDGEVLGRDDLPEALDGALPGAGPWRVHFHVPVHAELAAPLASTRDVLVSAAAALLGGARARTDHLEVETYTWSVLPQDQRPTDDAGLVAGLVAELGWARARLLELGLADA
ncbi:TIM barrel protein [Georgenia yuyongxinii]|uniref:TIM barrel protein n=1 Tax=Georgenia yuyongxinii TaxID=2589797 RepID=A0A5B8C7V9_9MICO|nr:metabolite traffic protein EboE [Georgenia yuyongxinii]QDC26110.1 TIM barrel protein [Georgenia yuyongxinii]